jgi:hypothetical protein
MYPRFEKCLRFHPGCLRKGFDHSLYSSGGLHRIVPPTSRDAKPALEKAFAVSVKVAPLEGIGNGDFDGKSTLRFHRENPLTVAQNSLPAVENSLLTYADRV